MKLDFAELAPDTVEDWKQHPGTIVLLKQLRSALSHWSARLEMDAASGEAAATKVASHGGGCARLRQVIEDIKEAKGKKSE